MARIKSFELFVVDLPFRKPFKHAAAERMTSNSIFLKCVTDSGQTGFGECLPREYVTGESRDGAYALLKDRILPRLVGIRFESLDNVKDFLRKCDGKAPREFGIEAKPQIAAWSAVDLALLDALGREFNEPMIAPSAAGKVCGVRYSGVVSADKGFKLFRAALKMRLYGMRQIKVKVDREMSAETIKALRTCLGSKADIRVDANMAWSKDEAMPAMQKMARYGVFTFEQPIAADKIDDLSALVRETGLGVMADESLNDSDSLDRLIEKKACTAVNVRISKCGGIIAASARCKEAINAGLTLQVGCQVGESSLLSAAHLAVLANVPGVRYAEGCFGLLLLKEDPVTPLLQFGYGGRAPARPTGPGLGVSVDESKLRQWTSRHDSVEATLAEQGRK